MDWKANEGIAFYDLSMDANCSPFDGKNFLLEQLSLVVALLDRGEDALKLYCHELPLDRGYLLRSELVTCEMPVLAGILI